MLSHLKSKKKLLKEIVAIIGYNPSDPDPGQLEEGAFGAEQFDL